MSYRTSPTETTGMPGGVPFIIGNEAAERFSFYGMKAVLVVFFAHYLHLMDGLGASSVNEAQATEYYHLFNVAVYFTPFLGAILADVFLGKFWTIMLLSLVYCAGHAALACMGWFGNSQWWLMAGLGLIALGSGGIKPCVSAHVGDQFGAKNAHLLERIFNWFYFSINLGAFASALLTPWLLEWYGPHWAFGVPGVLMAVATLLFWLGRHRFIHIPAGGMRFLREMFQGKGLLVMLKLLPLYLFVAIFWALFDQTSSTWIFQSQDMDRWFLGIEWLPSQIQSLNSLFILTFIPIFTYLVYPLGNRIWKLTPLRKIGLGLFIMSSSFGLIALVQQWIDGGARPHIGWQVLAFALLTAAEVMVSIVALEYAYTQAPKMMKSLVMCFYLGSVALGNVLVAAVNGWIQIPSAASEQLVEAIKTLPPDWQKDPRTVVLPGYDGVTGTEDDFVQRLEKGASGELEVPAKEVLEQAAKIIEDLARANGDVFPDEASARAALAELRDPWGEPLQFRILNSTNVRILSTGPDRVPNTKWDVGLILSQTPPAEEKKASWADRFHPAEPWLDRHKRALGLAPAATNDSASTVYVSSPFSGGQTKLQGAAYFRFFAWLMLGTAIAYVPFALVYRPKTYLQS